MIATSVPGLGASHSQSPSTSLRSGEHDTILPPRLRNRCSASRAGCAVVPPWFMPVFFIAKPPKHTSRSVWSAMTFHSVERLKRSSCVPTTRGMMTPVAPRL